MPTEAWERNPHVYVVSIDIKDGVYDAIHVFHTQEVAERYVEWQKNRNGEHCYITELPIEMEWPA
jgi:hypothetical protein